VSKQNEYEDTKQPDADEDERAWLLRERETAESAGLHHDAPLVSAEPPAGTLAGAVQDVPFTLSPDAREAMLRLVTSTMSNLAAIHAMLTR
jgi:hypothetical protein